MACVCTHAYMLSCHRRKGKAPLKEAPLTNFFFLYFYSLINQNVNMSCTNQPPIFSSLSLLHRNFRLFTAWATRDSQPPTAVHQAFPLPPLRPPANQIQTSLPCPSWDWSHGTRWQETKRRRRIHPTRSWIATRHVAWTPGPGLLWTVNTPSGRVIVGHGGTFSSWGESWILTRLRETKHFIGDFKRAVIENDWPLMMYQELTIEKGCVKEWRRFLSILKGKDKESDMDHKWFSTIVNRWLNDTFALNILTVWIKEPWP